MNTEAANGKRCVVIGASPETDTDIIRAHITPTDHIYCADGGYACAKELGLIPELVMGDFDSGEKPGDGEAEYIALPVKKDDTDTMAIIRECLKRGYDSFLLFGMTGGRFDHTLANLSVLYYLAKRGKAAWMIDRHGSTRVLCSGRTALNGQRGKGFGIFPFACEELRLSLKGFEYELENGVLSADFPMGASNTIISHCAEIGILSGNAVITVTENNENAE